MNGKRRVCAALVLLVLGTSVLIAQTSSQVDTWLTTAVQKSDTAVRLARQNAKANAERISSLIDEVTDIMMRVQNYLAQGKMTTDAQDQKLLKINANLNECAQRLAQAGY